MKKIFSNNAKSWAGLLALLAISSIGLMVYAGDPQQVNDHVNILEPVGSNPNVDAPTVSCENLDNDDCELHTECKLDKIKGCTTKPVLLEVCMSLNKSECDDRDDCVRNSDAGSCVDNTSSNNTGPEIPDGIYSVNNGSEKTLIFGETRITIKTSDKGRFPWGSNTSGDNYTDDYSPDPNIWGGGADNTGNQFSQNPDNLKEREGPCGSGYHVPSAGEWSKLFVTWCNLNACQSSLELDTYNLYHVLGTELVNKFRQDFDMADSYYRTSSPFNNGAFVVLIDYSLHPDYGMDRYFSQKVRCMRNEVVYPTVHLVTFNKNGGTITTGSVTVLSGETINLSNYKATKAGNYKFVGWNTDKNATAGIDNNYVVNGNVTLYAIFEEVAEITPNADGSNTISWSGINLTIAGDNLPGFYGWGAMSGSSNKNDRNAWGGGEDVADRFDSGNPRTERQGPCATGWHVPSRGEWADIIIARCHLENNDCEDDNIYVRDVGYSILHLSGSGLGQKFIDDFGDGNHNGYEPNRYRWSSSPAQTYWYGLNIDTDNILLTEHIGASDGENVRCVKNPSKTVRFNSNGGATTATSTGIIEGLTLNLAGYTASRDGYDFVGWGESSTSTTKVDDNYIVRGDVTLYAIFQKKSSGGSSSSGGGSSSSGGAGRKSSSTTTTTDKQESSVDTGSNAKNDSNKSDTNKSDSSKESSSNESQKGQKVPDINMAKYNSKYSFEMNQAYQFAYAYGITNKSNIANANMGGKLTRIQMAKMLSTYAINVLGKEPDYSRGTIKFSDVSNNLDRNYSNGVTLAYQLGIMGQNIRSGKFRPYDEVTRAEFGTALSRLLYETKDGTGRTKYYEPHLAKLYNEGIIAKRNPTMEEKRGYVMLMLTRSAE